MATGQAWRILNKRLECIDIPAKKKAKLLTHVENVVEICRSIYGYLSRYISLNWQALENAAILHDYYKFDKNGKKRKEHNKSAANFFRCKYKEYEVAEIIRQHRGDFEPKYCEIESTILRMADKLSKFREAEYKADIKEALEACNECLYKIELFWGYKSKESECFNEIFCELLKKEWCAARKRINIKRRKRQPRKALQFTGFSVVA